MRDVIVIEMIADKILKIAEDENIAVLGMGPASAMADEPPGFRPADYLPGVRSLLCFGIPVPRDIYLTRNNTELAWRSQNLLYRRLDTLSLRLSALLEESGAQALPVYGCMPLALTERGNVTGYINQIRMAQTAGIGAIGRNGLLVNSRYGSRLMLGGLITTASLPAVHCPESTEPGCPPGCSICSEACPVKAIMPGTGKVRIMRCLSYTARTPLMSKIKFLLLRTFNKDKAGRYMSMTAVDELTFHICSRCVALCPCGALPSPPDL